MKYHLSEDVKYGVTTLGAHRDDLLIQIEGRDSRSFASQGQSRSIVLSLKLAESEILTRASGSRPVVLLDDVMSELDASRREYLLNHIQDSQVFITCCEKAYFEGLKNGIIKEMAAEYTTACAKKQYFSVIFYFSTFSDLRTWLLYTSRCV